MTNQTNPPAFPLSTIDGYSQCGMALRDYFAAKALGGVITAIMAHEGHNWTSADFADEAYKIADAMLNARNNA